MTWSPEHTFVYNWGVPQPTGAGAFVIDNNRYYTPGAPSLPFGAGGDGNITSLNDWQQACQCDAHATISADIDLNATLAMARQLLGM